MEVLLKSGGGVAQVSGNVGVEGHSAMTSISSPESKSPRIGCLDLGLALAWRFVHPFFRSMFQVFPIHCLYGCTRREDRVW